MYSITFEYKFTLQLYSCSRILFHEYEYEYSNSMHVVVVTYEYKHKNFYSQLGNQDIFLCEQTVKGSALLRCVVHEKTVTDAFGLFWKIYNFS